MSSVCNVSVTLLYNLLASYFCFESYTYVINSRVMALEMGMHGNLS